MIRTSSPSNEKVAVDSLSGVNMMSLLPSIRYWPLPVIVGTGDLKLVDTVKVPSSRKVYFVTEGPNWLITVSVFHLPTSVGCVFARWQASRLASKANKMTHR